MIHKNLYKDPINGKLTGVCAGLANYFNLEVWLVRILVISAALLGGSFLVLLAYVAMSFMLEKQPEEQRAAHQAKQEHSLKNKPWKQGQNATQLLQTVDSDLNHLESSLRKMEAYVTSDAFKVNREFNRL